MELKVWVEGIQRIVCGVNEKTTCQDVVFALAHATGKTGRFTLIERWRNSERLLAPNEQPLKVLLKWGEHSNDVQFILQWSPLDPNSKAAAKSPEGQAQSGLPKTTNNGSASGPLAQGDFAEFSPGGGFNPLSRSSTSQLSPTRPLGQDLGSPSGSMPTGDGIKGKKKDQNGLTRGGAPFSQRDLGMSGGIGGESINSYNGKLLHSKSHTGIVQSDESESSHRKRKDLNLTNPPPYREPPIPGKSSGVGMNSGGSSLKELPPYRNPPPPNLNPTSRSHLQLMGSNHSPVSSTSSISGSISSSLGGTPQGNRGSPVLLNGSSSASSGNTASTSSGSTVNGGSSVSSGSTLHGGSSGSTGSTFHGGSSASTGSTVHGGSSVSTGGTLQGGSSASSGSTSNSTDSSKYMTPSQHSSSYTQPSDSTDSKSWRSKDHSLSNGETSSSSSTSTLASKQSQSPLLPNSTNPQYRDLIRLINMQREKLTSQQAELTQHDAEIMFWEGKAREQQRHMEFITKEISRLELISVQHESQVLSLSHLEDESDLVANESENLKTELDTLRTELSRCDNELAQCKQRIRLLTEELQTTQLQMNQRQMEWSQREATTLAEIERLKRELDSAKRDTDDVSDLSGSLDKEVSSLEAILAEKKKQMERLVSAMKEANLQSLTIQPSSEEMADGGTHYRSGSTRRMIGSPRQLENAAPTSKNPHGVWV